MKNIFQKANIHSECVFALFFAAMRECFLGLLFESFKKICCIIEEGVIKIEADYDTFLAMRYFWYVQKISLIILRVLL